MNWAYGVTTVPIRQGNLLRRTLNSLAAAGFPQPHIFTDGADDASPGPATARFPTGRTFSNWMLSFAELALRNPTADRYALFQDDFVTCLRLREYLEACAYAPRTYWNLLTFPSNQALARGVGWYKSNQMGRGAVALVFDREAARTLLTSEHMVSRPLDKRRGWRAVDGGIVTALSKRGYTEMVHNPSLVIHTGTISSMGNGQHPAAQSFRGEQFDAMELLCESAQSATPPTRVSASSPKRSSTRVSSRIRS